jgi:alkylmercury lyase
VTNTHTTPEVAELTRPGGALDLGHDKARLLVRMVRLLALGHPVTRDLALNEVVELGIDRVQAEALLEAWTERDDAGDIVGLGVTHNPTAHQMTIAGGRMWAWCGMDTLIFTHVLNAPITITSTAPGSGEVVRLHASPAGVTDITPPGAVITQRVPSDDQVDLSTQSTIWGTFCHHNLFFPNRAHAERWAAGRDDIVILSIEDGFAAARDMAGALLGYEPETSR